MALLLTVDTAPPKRVIGLGQRKCAKGAVEQEVCVCPKFHTSPADKLSSALSSAISFNVFHDRSKFV